MSNDSPGPPKTYRLHALDSPEGEAVLAAQGLNHTHLAQALAELPQAGEAEIRTVIGLNDDGVFGTSRHGWTADLPDAFKDPMIALPWSRVHELLRDIDERKLNSARDDSIR